jgi:hypothetical protein
MRQTFRGFGGAAFIHIGQIMTDTMPTVQETPGWSICPVSAGKTALRLDENTLSGLYEYGIIPQISMKGAAYAGQQDLRCSCAQASKILSVSV